MKTGEVLASVVVQKSITSAEIKASTFKYIDFDKILELEGGFSTNEPTQIALMRTVEKAVYALVMEGADRELWAFADKAAGQAMVDAYLRDERRRPEPSPKRKFKPLISRKATGDEETRAATEAT